MRPVMLDMDGFASFRQPTNVNFLDADYFALIGPTGSGKSTVIDAMTFALYGSVPRWEDERAVAPALAPTANRGTVRLLFDIGGDRYVVARELRRSAQGVSIKGSRLERLVDPTGLGEHDHDVVDLATDSAVTGAVEKLLGLSFKNFCQCVVLPQGQFADFLREKPAKRQKILFHLLGAERYDAIREQASTRAAVAAQRALVLGQQAEQYADATDTAQEQAEARLRQLLAVHEHLDAALPALRTATVTLSDAQRACAALKAEQQQLTGLTVPAQAAALDVQVTSAQQALATATTAETQALAADTAARELVVAGPVRRPLEQALRDHAEQQRVNQALPGVRAAATAADESHAEAERTYTAAGAEREHARTVRDSAATAAQAAAAVEQQLGDDVRRLRAVAVPPGLTELDERLQFASTERRQATLAVQEAEDQDTAARAAVAAAPSRAPLEKALTDVLELADTNSRLPALNSAHLEAVEQHQAAQKATAAGVQAHTVAVADLDGAALAHSAAALREHLSAGEACPVCEQNVTALPAPLDAPALAAARAAVKTAEATLDGLRTAESAAARTELKAASADDAAVGQAERLQAALAGHLTTEVELRAALTAIDALTEAVTGAAADLKLARARHAKATAAVDAVERDAAALRTALRTTRDPLVVLGAPASDDIDLRAAWTKLAHWAGEQATARARKLSEATTASSAATATNTAAQATFTAAEQAAEQHRVAETAATATRERCSAALEELLRRDDQLSTALTDAPSKEQAERDLADLEVLEAAARAADAAVRTARAIRQQAEDAAGKLAGDVRAAWQALRAARDQLVPLGAPELDGTSVLTGWTVLAAWAAAKAGERAEKLPAAGEAVTGAEQHLERLTRHLADELTLHDVELPRGDLASTAPPAVARALEQSRAAVNRIAERRTQAVQLLTDQRAAQTNQQVAKKLADMLRSNQFPRWLVASALDALVLDASATLSDLSGGQFELTHKSEDFYVIDHADADSLRSVRTLSGGETFQASLALALALSTQMSALSAGGAARLDSIFLDEGFGTLDEATLEIVAETLENLAHGERMVGVITHVTALAERVPVRFAVHRDARTSTVIREST